MLQNFPGLLPLFPHPFPEFPIPSVVRDIQIFSGITGQITDSIGFVFQVMLFVSHLVCASGRSL